MRVLISTFYDSPNYGSRLQATALAEYIRGKGYHVEFIDGFRANRYLLRHPSLIMARIYNRLNQRRRLDFFVPVEYQLSSKRQRRLDEYTKRYFPRAELNTDEKWKQSILNRDIYVVGGDIIWQPAMGYPTKNMLDFVYYTDLTHFSFGSSMGRSFVPNQLRRAYKKYLCKFKAVGVRETSTARLLSDLSGRQVEKVVDPTMLFDSDRWDEFAAKAELSVDVVPGRFILCYFVMEDPEYWEYVRKLQMAKDMQVVVLPMHQNDEKQPYTVVLDGTPYEFLWLIKNADTVCTDSLHACIFSLIYKKKLQLIRRKRKAEDEKYDDFLQRYHLQTCVVTDRSRPIEEQTIDFDTAHQQLRADREKAYAFLERALSQ